MSRPAALPDPHPDALPWKGPEIQSGSLQGYHLKNGHKTGKTIFLHKTLLPADRFPHKSQRYPCRSLLILLMYNVLLHTGYSRTVLPFSVL